VSIAGLCVQMVTPPADSDGQILPIGPGVTPRGRLARETRSSSQNAIERRIPANAAHPVRPSEHTSSHTNTDKHVRFGRSAPGRQEPWKALQTPADLLVVAVNTDGALVTVVLVANIG